MSDCRHTKGDGSWWEHDGRGIPLARVCGKCRAAKLSKYVTDIMASDYYADEDIDGEEY